MMTDKTVTAAIIDKSVGGTIPSLEPISKITKENSEIWDKFSEVWNRVCLLNPNNPKTERKMTGLTIKAYAVKESMVGQCVIKSPTFT